MLPQNHRLKAKVYKYLYLNILASLCMIFCHTIFLEDKPIANRCDNVECKKQNSKKKDIRKKVIKKLRYPGYLGTQESISNKLGNIQTLERKEPAQIYMNRVKSVFFTMQKFLYKGTAKNMLFTPKISENTVTLLTPYNNNERNTKNYKDLISIVKFQKVKHEVLIYLTETKHSIDEFWHLVKKFLIDDNNVFTMLKWNEPILCNMGPNATNDNILKLSDQINYSPLLYHGSIDKRYYIDKSIYPINCKYLKSHSITKNNNVCTNLALLDLYGYCHISEIVKKINTCLYSFGNFVSNDCKNFTKLLSNLNEFNKSYVRFANQILSQQILPVHFSIKLAPKLKSDVSNYKALSHLIYNNILQEWAKNLTNARETLLLTKSKYLQKNDGYQCSNKTSVLNYFDKIIQDIDTYNNLMANIYKTKLSNISLYMNKLPIWFPKLISVATIPIKWKIGLSNVIKENIDNSNAECIFKILKTILSELYNNSEHFIAIKLEDLVHSMDTIYKIYSSIINIYEKDFSLRNLLSKKDTYEKLKEFFTLDYKLSLMYIYYNMRKCSNVVDSIDKFLDKLNYHKDEIATLQCLIKNKGSIKNCNIYGNFDIIINLLSKLNISDFNMASLETIMSNISKHLDNKMLYDIIDEYKVCCHSNCLIPDYCNNNNVKELCSECINSQKASNCNSIYNNDIQNAIKECCFNGKIQEIKDGSQFIKYDPCKLGYKSTENQYKWEYPEFRCSLGTNEQKKCYSLLLNNMGSLQTIFKYILENNEGMPDSGETFCSNPKAKLDNLCCNSIRTCGICENFNNELCEISVADLIESRQFYIKNLEDAINKNFLEFLRTKTTTYSKDGFSESSVCTGNK